MTKIYVGSLSWDTSEDGLREAFEPFGEIESSRLVIDRETGRSRGFGFVTYKEKEDALKAIEEMNGKELDGRTLRVDEARERESQGGSRGRNRW